MQIKAESFADSAQEYLGKKFGRPFLMDSRKKNLRSSAAADGVLNNQDIAPLFLSFRSLRLLPCSHEKY